MLAGVPTAAVRPCEARSPEQLAADTLAHTSCLPNCTANRGPGGPLHKRYLRELEAVTAHAEAGARVPIAVPRLQTAAQQMLLQVLVAPPACFELWCTKHQKLRSVSRLQMCE